MKEIKVTTKTPTRINTFLRDAGIGSRRLIDDYITKNYITINNKPATLGDKVKQGDTVHVKQIAKDLVYALYHKPRGEITGKNELIPNCEPLGRLDKESEGLLLYSNDYRVVDALLNPKYGREKEYEVVVREKATPRVITLLKKGIYTQETQYAPVKSVAIYNEGYSLRIILTEGKKHEIRRMLNALNLTVLSLKRVRIMSFVLRGLKSGTAHILTQKQIDVLLTECGVK
ncbi:MAG: rRNA pseudouridine synthase [Candidatus Pacebacteria bacterium]|nr:rRNA pseudouridine synthase [Candidatus Paceibacterota bacterium]MBP9867163.1 rRNA pseudouridine synthase [Candidatus Paceibacterota bacterium]